MNANANYLATIAKGRSKLVRVDAKTVNLETQRYDSETGDLQDPAITSYQEDAVDAHIKELQDQLEDWLALKSDMLGV